jgi:YspA, cpYpsA-related SLOG family
MKIAIVGSRGFLDTDLIDDHVSGLEPGTTVVSGGAKGVDSRAEWAARKNGFPVVVFLPDWNRHGKKAGFLRNKQIVDACDEMVAFWDGRSRGTQHSISLARSAGKKVTIIMGRD